MAGDVVQILVPVDRLAHPTAAAIVGAQQPGDLNGGEQSGAAAGGRVDVANGA
jgi:hypothetical protein